MGLSYAYSAFVAIVALHGNGLTREEVEEVNRKIYRAKLEEHWFLIDPEKDGALSCSRFVEFRNGRYFLKPDKKIDRAYLERKLEEARIGSLPAWKRERIRREKMEREVARGNRNFESYDLDDVF